MIPTLVFALTLTTAAQEPAPSPAGVTQENPSPRTAGEDLPTSLAQAEPEQPVNYYVKNRGYRSWPEPDPVRYVRTLNTSPIQDFKDITWLDVGFEHRTRFEYRDRDFRRTPQTGQDEVFLLRTRAFAGVKEILDPFRAVVEFQDSRSYESDYPSDNRDVNEADLVQIYGELHFKDALGKDRPVVFRAGRQAFEITDRRLIARNEFRNTSNNFQGYRLKLGRQEKDWDVDAFALQPLNRLLDTVDEPFEDQWLYGGVFQWRRWSHIATLQPYYLDFRQTDNLDRDQHLSTIGLRGYGVAGTSGFDWELSFARQFGRTFTDQRTSAFAYAVEAGYTLQESGWKPRFSLFYGYGSGDKDPTDDENGRFNSLFGFNQPWSRNDYFTWDNVHAPKARAEFAPFKALQIDVGYGAFWLASDTDSWARANLRDTSGNSGTFLGHEADVRIRYRLTSRIALEASYAYFVPGEFPRNLGKDDESNFVYLQFTFSLFE
jgi:hypothetical protein